MFAEPCAELSDEKIWSIASNEMKICPKFVV